MRIVVICLGIFAVYLPVAIWLHHDYVRPAQPTGRSVELLGKFWIHPPDQYTVRPRALHHTKSDISEFVVYEDMMPLPRENFVAIRDRIKAENGSLMNSIHVRFRTSDSSDPRINGRKYWVVLPKLSP